MHWPATAEQYLKAITTVPITWLKDESYVEQVILNCGINAEYAGLESVGITDRAMPEYFELDMGMRLWQYPKQFSKYLVWLSDKKIESYLEIGTRFGGTFLVTVAYLSRFNPMKIVAGVDPLLSGDLAAFAAQNPEFKYLNQPTQSNEFTQLIRSQRWDLVFVDGDHNNPTLQGDWNLAKENSRFVAFHDVINVGCPDVVNLWQQLKNSHSNVEFVDQYTEVMNRSGKNYLGIGVVDLNS